MHAVRTSFSVRIVGSEKEDGGEKRYRRRRAGQGILFDTAILYSPPETP